MKTKRGVFTNSFTKLGIDFKFALRLFTTLSKKYGIKKAISEWRKYAKHQGSVLNASPNRYVKNGNNYFVLPDVPPINHKDFIRYLIKDIEAVNSNHDVSLVFAILCISSRCPYKCVYCYNSDAHQKTEILSLEILMTTINTLIYQGVKNIHLSGGEPMMRYGDILKILEQFGKSETGFWLLTTGWDLNEEKLKVLHQKGLRGLLISLDSNDANWVNDVKGSAKAFDYATNAIKNASKQGLLVCIDCVVNKKLLQKEKFLEFLNFAGSLGAHFINCYIPREVRHFPDEKMKGFSIQEYKQLENLCKMTQKEKSLSNLPIANTPDTFEAIRGCMGGKMFIYIDPEGNVKACPFKAGSIGNIRNDDIANLLNEKSFNGLTCSANALLSKDIEILK